jgi:hypothetical protein
MITFVEEIQKNQKVTIKARFILAPREAQIDGIGGKSMKFDDVTQWVIAHRESPT